MTAHRGWLLGAVVASLLLVPASARAAGGHYSIEGGTSAERTQITAALHASDFDWSSVPAQIQIYVKHGIASYAVPGQIWLDADLLDSGRFSWGVVQHEYAHQVDFFLLTDADRTELLQQLGGQDWWSPPPCGLPHAQLAAERFASTLAWSYWPSPDNVMRPQAPSDESAAMAPAAFRALLQRILLQGGSESVPTGQLHMRAAARTR
jgi:hypothetical protein